MKRRKEYENSNYTAFLIYCSKLLALGIKGILIVAGIAVTLYRLPEYPQPPEDFSFSK